ncbi:MAG: ABC transporter substrate-binding protein [Bacteroidota bacterium]
MLFVIVLLSASCGALKKADDPRKPRTDREELDEIEGKRVYNPETGKYEYVKNTPPEPVDTIAWRDPAPDSTPPISSEQGTVITDNPNDPTNPNTDPGGGIIYNPGTDVDSPKADQYNIAMMLPFLTNQFDPSGNRVPNNSSWAINYYAGAKMAMDRLNQENIQLNISVLDTKANETAIPPLLDQAELLNADLIIGPYRSKNVQQVADFALQYQKPLVSPYTASLSVTDDNPYYIQVNPSLKTHCRAIVEHLRKKYKAEEVTLLARNNNAELAALKYFQDANYEFEGSTATERFREKIFSDDSADFINNEDFTLLIEPGKTTVFVIPVWASESFVSNLLRKISVSKGANRVVVYGMPQWMNFNRISPDYFERLNVHISAANFTDNTASNIRAFKLDYYNRYGTLPTEAAFAGYDTLLYFGRMINKYGKRFQYYIDRDPNRNLHTTFAFEPVVEPTTTGAEDFSKIERFENKFVNILSFQGYRFTLAE